MQKIFYFLVVGLAFMALQVATVEADQVDTSHCDQFEGDPKQACIAAAESGPPDCAAMHPEGGTAHVDPPEEKLAALEAEMEASCEAGNCGISEATYSSLTSLGHSRPEIDCFLAEGKRHHDDGTGGHGDHRGMTGDHTGMTGDHTGMTGDHRGMTGDHTGMTGDHRGMTGDHTGMTGDHRGMTGDHTGN